MSEDLALLVVLAIPLGIAVVVSFIVPDRVRWVVGVGVVLAASLVPLSFVAVGDDGDGDWGTSTELFFAVLVAGICLLLWMVGVAFGWATGRAVRNARRKHPASLS